MESIQKSITINAPIDGVWKHLTTAELLGKWMCTSTMGTCSDFPLEKGQKTVMSEVPANDVNMVWRVVDVDAPHSVSYTFYHFYIGVETDLTFQLTEKDQQTHVQMTHSGFEKTSGDPQKNRDDHFGGWDKHLNRLKENAETA